ncbi:cation:proton antiporter [Lactobacillus sp. M0403]|uniref:cation:proton antiporter n=2 Tax=unclassified Lactobacillus TaxID=2620435 RepID=UPI000EFC8830|nr:cation:proton antiporter [Lactobacillus sp. ESL0263]MBI0092817.1 cation:proton antiporter [Lactobacillus sp. M0403]RMC50351.1 cation:proton antiporter [Lactobacillus sp. ESL0263]
MQIMGILCLILLFALIGGQIANRCGLPAVIGELLAGIVIGPAMLNWVQPSGLIKSFSDIGVVLLMFLAGLESDLAILKKLWKPSFLVATFGMVVPIVIAYLTGIAFKFSQTESLFLGITFAATSVSISVAVLQEMKKLETKEGMTILGAAVVDDLLSVILLSVVSSVTGTHTDSANANLGLGLTLLLQLVYLVILLAASIWLFPRMLKLSERFLLPAAKPLVTIIIVLLAAFGAEKVGLSNVIGAFFVGLAFSRLPDKQKLQKSFTDIGYSLFIPIFFASIGLEMSITGIFKDGLLFIVLFVGSVISKLVGASVGAKVAGFSSSSAYQVGTGMISRGEMALVVAQIGLSNHLLAPAAYSTVVGVIVLTTLIAPIMLKGALMKKR